MSTTDLSIAVPMLDPSGAIITIAFSEIAVLRVAPPSKTDFNRTVRSELFAFRPGKVQFGVFDRTQIKPHDADHAQFVRRFQTEMGWDASQGVPDGYYLFIGTKLSAYYPPLPDDDNADEQLAKAKVAGLGLLAAVLLDSQNLAKASMGVLEGALESEHGKRAAAFLKAQILIIEAAAAQAATEKRARDAEEARHKAQAKALDDEKARKETWAFKSLSLVRGMATEKDAKKAKRTLLKECHQDLGPASEAMWRHEMATRVNGAYDVVVEVIRRDANSALPVNVAAK